MTLRPLLMDARIYSGAEIAPAGRNVYRKTDAIIFKPQRGEMCIETFVWANKNQKIQGITIVPQQITLKLVS